MQIITETRKATKEDLQAIYDMVLELAIYEKEPDAVIASIEDYQKAFDQGLFEVFLAIRNGEIAGMALYYTIFSTWKGRMLYLEDFVVKERYRKEGIGQLLFDVLRLEARHAGAKLMKWQVLDWNEPALRFYEKNNAIIEKNWWNGKILNP